MGEQDYKPMAGSQTTSDRSLTLDQAVRAATASLRDQLREITGSEPFIETTPFTSPNGTHHYTLATYGAGKYVVMSRFSIDQLPGCCGIVVFYHASVAEDFRKKGLGSLLLKLREEAARKAGYTVALATVLATNEDEISILGKGGWVESAPVFKNKRTSNKVLLLRKTL